MAAEARSSCLSAANNAFMIDRPKEEKPEEERRRRDEEKGQLARAGVQLLTIKLEDSNPIFSEVLVDSGYYRRFKLQLLYFTAEVY